MTGLFDSRRHSVVGARPADFPNDLLEIADLIELSFYETMEESGRMMLRRARAMAQLGRLGWHFYRWFGSSDEMDWYHGFVWVEAGKIVGNVSLAPSSREPDTWAIANVAVHPGHRRRGIGNSLTQMALAEIGRQGGRKVVLQVKADNQGAATLYRALDFREVTRRTLWTRPALPCPEEEPSAAPPALGEPRARLATDWSEEFKLARRVCPEGLAWRWPVAEALFRPSLGRALLRALTGDGEFHWVVRAEGNLVGFLVIFTRPDSWQAISVVAPEWRLYAELPLLRAVLRHGGQDHAFSLETVATNAEDALARLGFVRRHTLIWMEKELHPPRGSGAPGVT